MDDAEERARADAQAAAAAAAAAEAAQRPHDVVAPREFEIRAVALPWWMRLGDLLRTSRRLQLGALAAGLALLLVAAWPRGEHTLSLGTLRTHAAQYDGQLVRVSGRVGEVFQVGAGYAFYLHQGHDTLVVFSRTREPQTDQHLVLNGTVSTGYLDGMPRTALFESDSDK